MNRPYVAPRRVTLIGHDHFHQPHMTDMQREIRDPKLQPVENPTLFGCDFPPIAWGGVATVICAAALFLSGAW